MRGVDFRRAFHLSQLVPVVAIMKKAMTAASIQFVELSQRERHV
jgi:hypothetical protein